MAQILAQQVYDFTGGLNFRADQFQLKANESPGMLNVEIDPRGGVFSRAGYVNLHSTAITATGWNPKRLFNYNGATVPTIMLTTGLKADATPISGTVQHSTGSNFSVLNYGAGTPIAVTSSNGASFAQWEETLYMAIGSSAASMYKWINTNTYATALTASGPTWQPYAVPTGGYMPRAEINITHANKHWVANTYENGVAYPNRVRWSHENLPEDWMVDDYIDIVAGGDGVTGLQVVDGQLLIFKPKAVYLLMGYDADSFQLVELSITLGIDYPQQAVVGDGGCYFFDYPNGLHFYNRNGIQDIFERIRPIIINNEVNSVALDQITLSFIRNRVWISLPYLPTNMGSPPSYPNVNLIYDKTIGSTGAYTMFQTAPSLNDDATPVTIDGYGLVNGVEWRDSSDQPIYLMISPDDDYKFVYSVDDYDNTIDTMPHSLDGKFETTYRTSWFDNNRYVQLKTFIRPYLVLKEVSSPTIIQLSIFRNYDESTTYGAVRSITLSPTTSGGTYSTNSVGGVYGTATYGTTTVGAALKTRGLPPLGKAFSIQLEFSGPDSLTSLTFPGRKWGLNSIAYKFKNRQIRGN